jgi:hypothetical protein
MSTRAIREILERVKENPNGIGDADLGVHDAALAEVEAIEKAARFITNVDTDAIITTELARAAIEANDTLERIAKETSK